MTPELISHREAKGLFGALVDQELSAPAAALLKAHLDGCDECRGGWQRYERTVLQVRGVERLRAPPTLAGSILRRVRRRRFSSRALALAQAHQRVPVEMLLPPLVAAAVAALLYFLWGPGFW